MFTRWVLAAVAVVCSGAFVFLMSKASTLKYNPYHEGTATLVSNPRDYSQDNTVEVVATARLENGKLTVLNVDTRSFAGQRITYWEDLKTGEFSTYPNQKARSQEIVHLRWLIPGIIALALAVISIVVLLIGLETQKPAKEEDARIPAEPSNMPSIGL